MPAGRNSSAFSHHSSAHRPQPGRQHRVSRDLRPVAALRQRGTRSRSQREDFTAPEVWHEPVGCDAARFIVHPAGAGYAHPVTVQEVRERLALLPEHFTRNLEVVQFSSMTRKRRTFACYGMQWGTAVYLYPIEQNLVERYLKPPKQQQIIEARMFGGEWSQDGKLWRLTWTERAIKDFFLNNVLIHEIGHLNDARNSNTQDRERFANWFAIEYGYRPTR